MTQAEKPGSPHEPRSLVLRPSGTIRITTVEHAAKVILVPGMKRLLVNNPDIKVEITIDYGLADVVADRFDAGDRLGGEMAKDMIAMRIGPDISMAIVGAPGYFRMRPAPASPGRAAMVEATTKFFAFAKQAEASKPTIPADAARAIENLSEKLLDALKNHRRYGTLVAADFGIFAAPEIMRVMREEKETRDICKR